jgi:hypothetical protein
MDKITSKQQLISGNRSALGNAPVPVRDFNTLVDEVTTLNDAASTANSNLTYTELEISSANILLLGSQIELVAAPGAGMYLDVAKVILEYTHVTTAYTLASPDWVTLDGAAEGAISKGLITTDSTKIASMEINYSIDSTNEINYSSSLGLNQALNLATWSGGNPTLGDGTMLAKVWYTTRTAGTEL